MAGTRQRRMTATMSVADENWSSCRCCKGTLGPDVVDIRKLYGETGIFTYDPGFTSTAAASAKITFIDGDEGVLLHRGYPIEELAENSDFLEVCYLLLNGELPTTAQHDKFEHDITYHTMLHEQIDSFFPRLPPRRAPDGGA